MHRSFFALIFLLIALPAAYSQQITIGIIGDQTMAPSSNDQYEILQRGVSALRGAHPDIVLHTGDLVESTADFSHPIDPELYRRTFISATNILKQLPCTWHLSAGDHDVNPPYFKPSDTTARKLFQTLYPPAAKHLYYSFNRFGYHFVALSSQEIPQADPRWGVIFRAHLSPEQIEWLGRDLAQNAGARGTIVFLHQPLWYQWGDWAPVHRLLRKARVVAVIAGHFHYNQDEGELDGIRYIVVGATGGAIKSGSPHAGDLQHVSVLQIAGHKVLSLKIVPLRNEPVHTFSSRRDMDRVQALAVNIGNVLNDTAIASNRIGRVGDTNIWKSCTADADGAMSLRSIGNPLDVPVQVSITPADGNMSPISSEFNSKVCLGNDKICELPPGSLIAFSNNSTVQPFFQACGTAACPGQTAEPLWTARFPSQTSDGKAATQNFILSMSFQGSSGNMMEQRIVFSVQSKCPEP